MGKERKRLLAQFNRAEAEGRERHRRAMESDDPRDGRMSLHVGLSPNPADDGIMGHGRRKSSRSPLAALVIDFCLGARDLDRVERAGEILTEYQRMRGPDDADLGWVGEYLWRMHGAIVATEEGDHE